MIDSVDVAVVVLDVIVELPLLELVLVIELGVRLWVDLGSKVKTMKAGSLGKVKTWCLCLCSSRDAKSPQQTCPKQWTVKWLHS